MKYYVRFQQTETGFEVEAESRFEAIDKARELLLKCLLSDTLLVDATPAFPEKRSQPKKD